MGKISLQDIHFSYTADSPRILDNLSLDLFEGEIVLLVGPTGSGKTTLLQIIAGVTPQVTGGRIGGKVLFDETDILRSTTGAARGQVGLVLQDPEAQLVNLTVSDEIVFGPENLGLPEDEICARLEWALEKCRLTSVRDAYVYALSGGQKQRIAIAAGLAMKPEVLLLDGPLTNLDPQGADEVLQTIAELIEANTTKVVVISSNKIDALLPLATRVLVLNEGRIAFDERPEGIIHIADQLAELGLFVPEVVSLWPTVRSREPEADLPKTAAASAETLKRYLPVFQATRTNRNTANHQENLIDIKDVSFDYGLGPVLKGIDLTIKKGEFAAVVGQNGSGKSTLMRLITGLSQPEKGSIAIAGKDTRDFSPQGTVGYVFQYPEHQFVSDTVEKELRFGLANKLAPEEIESRVREIITLFGMEGKEAASPYTLSVGEKRMLSVASMLVLRPQLLILDEPTTGLDRRLTTNLMQILRRFVEESGLTVLQVSHDMEQVAQYCSKVAVIDQGKITFTGTPVELFLNQDVLHRAKLDAPVICQIAHMLFPEVDTIPVTVEQFLEEVHYASH